MTEPCRGCGKDIFFGINERTDKRIPLDPDPVPEGNVWISGYRGSVPLLSVVSKEWPAPAGHDLFVSHFATCTEAARFRRPKRKGRPAGA